MSAELSKIAENATAFLLEWERCAIIATDDRGQVTLFNRGAERLLGYRAQDVVGSFSILGMIDAALTTDAPDGSQAALKSLTGATVQPSGRGRRINGITRDGRRIPLDMQVSAIRGDGAEPAGHFFALEPLNDDVAAPPVPPAAAPGRRDLASPPATNPKVGTDDHLRAQVLANLGSYELYLVREPGHPELVVSPNGLRMVGWDPNLRPLTAQEYFNLIHPADRARVKDEVASMLRNGERHYHSDYRILRPDGEECHLRDVAEVAYDREGKPLSIFGIVQDITAEKILSTLTRKADRLAAAAIDAAGIGLIVYDAEFRVTAWNAYLRNRTGITAQDVLGRSMADLLPDADTGADAPWRQTAAGRCVDLRNTVTASGGVLRFIKDIGKAGGYHVAFCPLADLAGGVAILGESPLRDACVDSDTPFRRLVELSREAMWINRDNRIIYINAAAVRLLGETSADAVIGKSPLEYFRRDSRADVQARIQQALQREHGSDPAEERIVTRDGQERRVEVTRSPLPLAGEPTLLVVLRDITERFHMEQQIARSEMRYRNLLELCPQPIWLVRDWKIVFVNAMALRLMRATAPEQLLDHPVLDFVHPDYHLLVRERVRNGIATGKTQPLLREKLLCLDGETRDVEVSSAALLEDGESTTIAVMHDITERLRSQQSLREMAVLNRQILESANEGIVVFDTGLKIRSWNPFMVELTGLREDEVIGRSIYDYADSARLYRPHAYMRRALEGEVVSYPERFGRIKGTPNFLPPNVRPDEVGDANVVWTHCSWAPLKSADGVITGVIATITDITEEERSRAKTDRLVEELRTLATYTEGVREDERTRIARELHDDLISTLATVRIGLSAQGQTQGAFPVDVTAMLQGIDTAIQSTRRIIKDLRPPVLDELGIWSAIEWRLSEVANAAKVKTALEVAPELRRWHIDDVLATTIYRIVQESLSNVVKHANARRVEVRARVQDGDLVLDMTDDGKGPHAPEYNAAEHWGLLGMQERARAHGGVIEFGPAPSAGTRLRFTVPLG